MACGTRSWKPCSQGLSNNTRPEPNQPNSSYDNFSLMSFRLLSSHLRMVLHRCFFFSVGSLATILALLASSFQMSCSSYTSSFNHFVLDERYKLWCSSLSFFLGPSIHLRILFSNTLNLHSSLNVRDPTSEPYSTTSNIIILRILIFKFSDRSREGKSI